MFIFGSKYFPFITVGFPNEHLANTEEKDVPSPMFSTAVGLILRGWDEGKYNDFIENVEEPREKEKINNIFKSWAE